MEDFLGFISITLVCLITFILCLRWPRASKFLYVALSIRISVLLLGHYIITLPDSTADAQSIEGQARFVSENGFDYLKNYYPGISAMFIRWFLAVPYYLLIPSALMAKSISLLFGILSVFLLWKLSKNLWGNNIANRVGWFGALFPSLILYSVLTMRSVYIFFFLLVAIYGVVKWTKTKNLIWFFLAGMGFIGATFFHGASIVGAVTFLGIITLISINDLVKSLMNLRISLTNLFILVTIIYIFSLYLSNQLYFPYVRNFEFISNPDILVRKTRHSVMGGAAFPIWTVAETPIELIYKIPVRAVYFVFAPFPWDINEAKHIFGMIDGLLFIYLTFLILKNIKFIWNNLTLRIIFLILITYIIVFAVGVGNFGTGIRHRSKFVFMFILLAAPFIADFKFFSKENINRFYKSLRN